MREWNRFFEIDPRNNFTAWRSCQWPMVCKVIIEFVENEILNWFQTSECGSWFRLWHICEKICDFNIVEIIFITELKVNNIFREIIALIASGFCNREIVDIYITIVMLLESINEFIHFIARQIFFQFTQIENRWIRPNYKTRLRTDPISSEHGVRNDSSTR